MRESKGIVGETEMMARIDRPNPDAIIVTIGAEVVTANAATDLHIGGSGSVYGVAVGAGAPVESVRGSGNVRGSAKTEIIVIPRLGDGEVEAQMVTLEGKKAKGRVTMRGDEILVLGGKMSLT
jgi:hypothetical protein